MLVNHASGGVGYDTSANKLKTVYAELDPADLIALAQTYHYDLLYFGYDFDLLSKQISGFE